MEEDEKDEVAGAAVVAMDEAEEEKRQPGCRRTVVDSGLV